ncbi:MAG: ABC transporter ATP-binding protein [Bifidobacteriaceae bacterium]|nr:ABC transporter ATP-binding protein [Bifidobacteriaceae bacterium]
MESHQSPAIHIEHLTKRYGAMTALDAFDLTVRRGEIFGLLGPNGSGKTTSIRCMLGLLTFDAGSIEILGERMTPTSYELRRRIGVVPQEVAVFEALTVQENIDYFCSLYVPDRKRRAQLVDEAIAFVGLEDFRKFRPKKLSGGLLRRLNIACGIAHQPELIFFDEPTVAVDPQSRNAILEGIKRLNAHGATVVYTSHYMEEVEQICDRILIMDHGKHLALGTADELKRSTGIGETISIEAPDLTDAAVAAVKALPAVTSAERGGGDGSNGDGNGSGDDGNGNNSTGTGTGMGTTLTVVCSRGERNLIDVLDALHDAGVHPGHVSSQPPTLNDVFLSLTGKQLRD